MLCIWVYRKREVLRTSDLCAHEARCQVKKRKNRKLGYPLIFPGGARTTNKTCGPFDINTIGAGSDVTARRHKKKGGGKPVIGGSHGSCYGQLNGSEEQNRLTAAVQRCIT